MAALNLNIRRTRDRANDLFGACSDDDLMSWGQSLVDAEPCFDDEFGTTLPATAVVAEPEPTSVVAESTSASTTRTVESVLVMGAKLALGRRR